MTQRLTDEQLREYARGFASLYERAMAVELIEHRAYKPVAVSCAVCGKPMIAGTHCTYCDMFDESPL